MYHRTNTTKLVHAMIEHVYMYIKEALILFTVEVGVAEPRTHLKSVRMCIYYSNLERPSLTHEGHNTFMVEIVLWLYFIYGCIS